MVPSHLQLEAMPSFDRSRVSLSLAIFACSLPQVVATNNTESCRIQADPDILGLGVRLGLYFQIAANILLQVVRAEEVADSFLVTAIFFTGFLTAAIYSAAGGNFAPSATIACTWYPVLLLCGLNPLFYSLTGMKATHGALRILLAFVLFLLSLALNSWFWVTGLYTYHPDQCMEPRVFFFANVSAYGGIRYFFRFFSFFLVVGLPVLLTVYIIVVWKRASKRARQDVEMNNDVDEVTSTHSASAVSEHSEQSEEPEPSSGESAPTQTPPETQVELASAEGPPNLDNSESVPSPKLTGPEAPDTAESKDQSSSQQPDDESKLVTPVPSSTAQVDASPSPPSQEPVAASISGSTKMSPNPRQIRIEKRKDRPFTLISFTINGFLRMALYVIATELQLTWNHLDGINTVASTGQILPLVIGCMSLLRSISLVGYALWSGKINWNKSAR